LIPETLLTALQQSTSLLVDNYEPPKGKSKRGDHSRYHLGNWCKYMKVPKETTETANPHAKKWLAVNKPLFELLSNTFQRDFPCLFEEYNRVIQQFDLNDFFCG